jgi:hypothetical protein
MVTLPENASPDQGDKQEVLTGKFKIAAIIRYLVFSLG